MRDSISATNRVILSVREADDLHTAEPASKTKGEVSPSMHHSDCFLQKTQPNYDEEMK